MKCVNFIEEIINEIVENNAISNLCFITNELIHSLTQTNKAHFSVQVFCSADKAKYKQINYNLLGPTFHTMKNEQQKQHNYD